MAQGIEGFIPYINRKPLSDPLFLERARNPQDFPVLTSKEGGRDIYETHRMAHKAVQDNEGNIRGIAFPNIIFDGKELVNLPKRGINPADYALETGNYKLFDTVSEARDFAINYKKLPEFEALGGGPRSFEPGGVVEKERTPFEKNIDQNLKRIFYDSYNQNIDEDTRVEAIREQIKQDPNALERNRAALQNLQDFAGYTFEPDSILEEVAAQEAFVRGTVPFGLEDQVYLGGTDNSVVYGVNSQNLETGVRRILMPGKFPSPVTPIHEGLHSFYSHSDLPFTTEELMVRALDLLRAKRSGDPEQIEAEKRSFRQYARMFPSLGQRDVEEALENTDDPKKIAKLDKKLNELIERNSRRLALVGSTQLSDKFYEGLRDSQKERLRRGAEKYINSRGQKIYDLSDEEFQDLLEYAPGFEQINFPPVSKKRYEFKPRNFNEGGVVENGGVAGFIPFMLGFPPEPSMDQMRENYQQFEEEFKENPKEALRQAANLLASAGGRSKDPRIMALSAAAKGGLSIYDYLNPDDGLVPDTGIGVPPPTDPSSTPGFDLLSNVYGMIGGKKATDYGPAVDRGKELEAQGESPIDIANKTEEEFGVRAVRDDDGEFKIEIPTSSFTTDITGTFMTYGEGLDKEMIRNEKRVVDVNKTTAFTKLMLSDEPPADIFRPSFSPTKIAKTPFRTANLQIMPDIYERTKSGKYKLVQQSPLVIKKETESKKEAPNETIFHIQHNKIPGTNKTIMRANGLLTDAQIAVLPPDLQERAYNNIYKKKNKRNTMLELAQTQEELVQLGAPTLSQVLDFPQLYRQYPEFAKIPVVRGDEKKSMLKRGERALTSSLDFEGSEQYILINDHSSAGSQENEDKKSTDILIQIVSTLMHEAAHDIQAKEGMAPGGSFEEVTKQLASFVGKDFLLGLPRSLANNVLYSTYRALGGEVDARLPEYRLQKPDLQLTETFTQTRAGAGEGEGMGFPLSKRTLSSLTEANLDLTNYRDLLVVRDLIKQKEDKYLKDLASFEGDTSYIGKLKNKEGEYYKKPHKTFTEKFEEKINEGLEKGTITKKAQQDMFPENFEDGGVVGYFKRPEIDGMLYPSEFEKDVTEKPGYEYGMILPISSNVETGETQFDLAGGITGGIGRGIATLDRAFGGIPTTEQDVMNAALEVVGPSSGIAGITAGPGQLPGLIGAFNLKHGSGALFDKLRRSETGAAGPGVYGAEDTNAALGYAISRAKSRPLENDDIAYEYKEMYEDPSEGANVLGYALEAGARKFIDKTNDTTSFIFSDDSMMTLNRALVDEEIDYDYIKENGAKHLIEEIDSGELKLTFQGAKQGYIYDLAIKETKDDFFDFTKPLKDQPSKHRQALLELAEKTGYDSPDEMGGSFYRHLEGFYGSDEAASKKLSELGIVGNKTLLGLNDEAYVVFDPDKIEIKGREVANFADGGVAGLASIAQNMFTN